MFLENIHLKLCVLCEILSRFDSLFHLVFLVSILCITKCIHSIQLETSNVSQLLFFFLPLSFFLLLSCIGKPVSCSILIPRTAKLRSFKS